MTRQQFYLMLLQIQLQRTHTAMLSSLTTSLLMFDTVIPTSGCRENLTWIQDMGRWPSKPIAFNPSGSSLDSEVLLAARSLPHSPPWLLHPLPTHLRMMPFPHSQIKQRPQEETSQLPERLCHIFCIQVHLCHSLPIIVEEDAFHQVEDHLPHEPRHLFSVILSSGTWFHQLFLLGYSSTSFFP